MSAWEVGWLHIGMCFAGALCLEQCAWHECTHIKVYINQKLIVCDSSCVGLLIVQWILSRITAWSLMVGTPINQVRRLINQGLIKDLISSFQRSTDSNGEIRSLIRPWLIGLRT